MAGKYFNVTVKPEIAASLQHAAAFGTGDLVFDWTAFDVPRGANKLTGVTALIRKENGTSANEFGFFLLYAKSINGSAPSSLGTINATCDGVGYYNNVIGKSVFLVGDYTGNQVDNMHVAGLNARAGGSDMPNTILQGETESGANVGYDRLYVACISEGAGWDFGTAVALDAGVDVSGEDGTIDDLDGTACNISFAPGDVLHAQDDIIVGEVASVTADAITFKFNGEKTASGTSYSVPTSLANWRIQNGAGAAGDLANNDELYNINPITLILSFEK